MITHSITCISDMKVLFLLFAATILLTTTVAGPIDNPSLALVKALADKGVATAFLKDKTIQSYGIDPRMLKFRDEVNNLIPQDVLNTIQVL